MFEATWENMGTPISATLFDFCWKGDVDQPLDALPSEEILSERFLEITLASVKHLGKSNLSKMAGHVFRLDYYVSNR